MAKSTPLTPVPKTSKKPNHLPQFIARGLAVEGGKHPVSRVFQKHGANAGLATLVGASFIAFMKAKPELAAKTGSGSDRMG
eukprot:CAMPEP_0185772986 /NCGR_PEP_ID=MMETSP1174-20130828/72111_1 /TAXON_ID=35687 /ORGANISM="Dictyocha speculum, Strain CCMP1381" /LENGTH=80 /DNA_ID=CAMNT_0028459505 /DNA_START=63 /DNA_END=302 /DNA_ORIENTATION=+